MTADDGSDATAEADTASSPDVEVIDRDETTDERDELPDGEALIERIEDRDSEEVADRIQNLRERARAAEETVESYETRIDELESQLKRTQADFQNYKKRAERQREDERERATEDLVTRLLDVRDNLHRALEQEEGAEIRPGVETTVEEFDRVLDAENVATIDPAPGAEIDPQRHEVMLRVDSDQPTDTVAEVFQPGYEMGEKVLRPAQVTVSE